MVSATALFAFILVFPLLGFLINGIFGLFIENFRLKKRLIAVIANVAVFIPFTVAVYLFFQLEADSEAMIIHYFTWFEAGNFSADIAYRVDQLSIVMTLVITGVGFLIHVYSIGYMEEDEGFWKFFSFLNLFIFAMLNLVLANNLLLLFFGWEGVGLCSYLLIGFWYADMAKSKAAKKAFIYNRIGDFAFLIALFMIFESVGSLNYDIIFNDLNSIPGTTTFIITLLIFIGATGKSAQIPLFVWLPDAMAGPTPVSALIHAATMVTSGIYLISRMSAMYVMVPEVMLIIAVIGALTALVAATIALTQYDIKSVLAYSTISQLGFMFLALGSGAFVAAIFHVVTHAFFKACLFLGSGSVIHSMHRVEHGLEHEGKKVPFDPQDMRNMGGLKKFMPSTYKTFLISTIAIAGIPPLAGFFSKDEILAMTMNSGLGDFAGGAYLILWTVAMISAFLTAFYMFRLTYSTFHGSFKLTTIFKEAEGAKKYITENSFNMTMPLWILAFLAIIGGFIGIPNFVAETFTHEEAHINLLHNWLAGVTSDYELYLSHTVEWVLMAVSVIVAIAGSWLAYKLYSDDNLIESDEILSSRFKGFYHLWTQKYHVDEVYEGLVARPTVQFSEKVLAVFDLKILDGLVNVTAGTIRLLGNVFRYIQTGVVSHYAFAFIIGVILILYIMVV